MNGISKNDGAPIVFGGPVVFSGPFVVFGGTTDDDATLMSSDNVSSFPPALGRAADARADGVVYFQSCLRTLINPCIIAERIASMIVPDIVAGNGDS